MTPNRRPRRALERQAERDLLAQAPPRRRVPVAPGWAAAGVRRIPSVHRTADAVDLQRLAGNRATASRIAALQRLAIYGRAAREASPLPVDVAAAFRREVDAGDQAAALATVVDAMTARGELDAELLRTSGDDDLWQIRDAGGMAASVSFRPPFADPGDPARRQPNPRFTVSSAVLRPGRPDALERLHTSILHEFRHVEQAAERVNRAAGPSTEREPGYGNDPDELDAYIAEVESAYARGHLTTAAIQAGVHWELLAAGERAPFAARWTAAQARVERILGYGVDRLLRTSTAERYREQLRELERRAREARERHAH